LIPVRSRKLFQSASCSVCKYSKVGHLVHQSASHPCCMLRLQSSTESKHSTEHVVNGGERRACP
jgi:hypothetical protein